MNKIKRKKIKRKCGPCTACCTWMSVDEIEKPLGEPCPKLCDAGCSIYKERPPGCVKFRCAWLDGHTPLDLRPDLSGIMLYASDSKIGTARVIKEIEPGALKSEKNAAFIASLDDRYPVILVDIEGKEKLRA